MQRCPKCNRTYQDDTQKFCTFDGGRLMVDTQAPTTLDLGPAPTVDPLGATVMGNDPDLNKTVAGAQPPLTSEIPPPAPTGPASPPPLSWSNAPTLSAPPPTYSPAPTGPTTTSPLTPPPSDSSSQPGSAASDSGSGSIAQHATQHSAQPPQTAPVTAPSGPQSAPLPAPALKKRSSLPMIIGGLAVLLLLVIGGGALFYFLAMKPKIAATNGSGSSIDKNRATTGTNANTGNSNTGTSSRRPPVEAPPNSTKFVNTREKLTGSLSEHFVDFSLYYPNGWTVDPKAGTPSSSNFFKADRMLHDETGDYLQESAAVSWYQSNGTMALDRPIFPNRVEFFNNLFSKDYPNYQKVSEGETRFNDLDGYQFTFKSLVKGTGKGDVTLWGRVIFLPVGSEDARNGVVLLTLASSAAPEIKSADDVGEKGELPIILKTFTLGPQQQ